MAMSLPSHLNMRNGVPDNMDKINNGAKDAPRKTYSRRVTPRDDDNTRKKRRIRDVSRDSCSSGNKENALRGTQGAGSVRRRLLTAIATYSPLQLAAHSIKDVKDTGDIAQDGALQKVSTKIGCVKTAGQQVGNQTMRKANKAANIQEAKTLASQVQVPLSTKEMRPVKGIAPAIPRLKESRKSSIESYFLTLPRLSISSSPSPTVASSDSIEAQSTPPSSPLSIPRFNQGHTLPRQKRRLTTKRHHSFLDSFVSDDVSNGESEVTSATIGSMYPKPVISLRSASNYQQMHLDIGSSPIVDCKECGMNYNRTSLEDRKAHHLFHRRASTRSRSMDGLENKDFVLEKKEGGRHVVAFAEYRSNKVWRDKFEDFLEATSEDLPGLKVGRDELWDKIKNPHNPNDPNLVPRYRIYAYTIDNEPAAVLLAERIGWGGEYYQGPSTHTNQRRWYPEDGQFPYDMSQEQEWVNADNLFDCYLGVDRIWTHRNHQHQHLAQTLLDWARKTFVPGLELTKQQIAFSRPTCQGREFAIRYCRGVFKNMQGVFGDSRGINYLVNAEEASNFIKFQRLLEEPELVRKYKVDLKRCRTRRWIKPADEKPIVAPQSEDDSGSDTGDGTAISDEMLEYSKRKGEAANNGLARTWSIEDQK